jgi:urease accessory protein
MAWHANLDLHYSAAQGKTGLHFTHSGPLRILKSLYPEGPAICHNVVVHPPGGIVGGDTLSIKVQVGEGAHALITTPGATRFYKSPDAAGVQRVTATVENGARLEWLPLEAIAYSGCNAINHASFQLAPQAQMIGWDITAFGLPAANLPYATGRFTQNIEIPNLWLERASIDAADNRLMNGKLGLAGQRCMGSLFFARGSEISRAQRERITELLREVVQRHKLEHADDESAALGLVAGVTAPNPRMLIVRALSPVVEPCAQLFKAAWSALRAEAWGLPHSAPRIWAM